MTIQERANKRWERQLKKDGPMYCKGESCVEFREKEPEFAQQLQDAGIIAHYQGKSDLFGGGDHWMLSGITPVGRGALERMVAEHKSQCPHIPRCFKNSDGCWNYDEAKKRVDAYPNYP